MVITTSRVPNKALHLTTFPLRSKAAGESCRYQFIVEKYFKEYFTWGPSKEPPSKLGGSLLPSNMTLAPQPKPTEEKPTLS